MRLMLVPFYFDTNWGDKIQRIIGVKLLDQTVRNNWDYRQWRKRVKKKQVTLLKYSLHGESLIDSLSKSTKLTWKFAARKEKTINYRYLEHPVHYFFLKNLNDVFSFEKIIQKHWIGI